MIHRYYTLQCDGCSRVVAEGESAGEVWAEFKRVGGKRTKHGDLCENCQGQERHQ